MFRAPVACWQNSHHYNCFRWWWCIISRHFCRALQLARHFVPMTSSDGRVIYRVTGEKVKVQRGKTGAQGPRAGQRQNSVRSGGLRKAWDGTLGLEVMPRAGCSGLAAGAFLCVAQGTMPFLVGSVGEEMWFPTGDRKIHLLIG